MLRRPWFRALLIAVFAYYIVLPSLLITRWRTPSVAADIPGRWPHNQDMPIRIRVSAWHPHFSVLSVRYLVDYYQTTAHGPRQAMPTQILYQEEKRRDWGAWRVNRLLYPRTRVVDVTLPLAQMAQEGQVQPGTVVGTLDVNTEFIGDTDDLPGMAPLAPTATQQIQFATELE